jgi:hypothetical protein
MNAIYKGLLAVAFGLALSLPAQAAKGSRPSSGRGGSHTGHGYHGKYRGYYGGYRGYYGGYRGYYGGYRGY